MISKTHQKLRFYEGFRYRITAPARTILLKIAPKSKPKPLFKPIVLMYLYLCLFVYLLMVLFSFDILDSYL